MDLFGSKKKKWKREAAENPLAYLNAAIIQGDIEGFTYILGLEKSNQDGSGVHAHALKEIAKNDALDMLDIFLEKKSLTCFGSDYIKDKQVVSEALTLAKMNQAGRVVNRLWSAANRAAKLKFSADDMIEVNINCGDRNELSTLLSSEKDLRSKTANWVVLAAGAPSDEVFFYLLEIAINCSGISRPDLNQAFMAACKAGKINRVEKLIDMGADIHHANDNAVFIAAQKGDRDLLQLLQRVGFNFQDPEFVKSWKLHLALRKISAETNDYVIFFSPAIAKNPETSSPVATVRAAAKKETPVPRKVPVMDILTETVDLPNGITLTTVFNFITAQQMIVTSKDNLLDTKIIPFRDLEQSVVENAEMKLIGEKRRSVHPTTSLSFIKRST